jgi:hypothetical protein
MAGTVIQQRIVEELSVNSCSTQSGVLYKPRPVRATANKDRFTIELIDYIAEVA